MKLWIDVEDDSGARLGPGPVRSLAYVRTTTRLDRGGEWAIDVPATDTRAADLLQSRRRVRIYTFINGQIKEIGGGHISNLATVLQKDAPPLLRVSGADMVRELVTASVLNSVSTESDTIHEGLIDTYAQPPRTPAAWSLTGADTLQTLVSHLFKWESVLEALNVVSGFTGEHFRLDESTDRAIKWLGPPSGFSSSGVRAVTNADPSAAAGNANVCLIDYIERACDSWDLVNRLYPFGALVFDGSDDEVYGINLDAATEWPDGTAITTNPHTIDGVEYEINTASRYVQSNTSIGTWGILERKHDFPTIGPDTDSGITGTMARNQLLAAAIERLRNYSQPQEAYNLIVVGLQTVLYPGQTIRVQARKYIDGERPIDIDADLIILESSPEFTNRGIGATALTVSTVAQWPITQERLFAQLIF